MSNLYRSSVSDHHFTQEGCGYFIQRGEPQTVGGDPMVRLSGGTLVPAAGWHAEFGDAVREAAQRIEALGHRLLAQADRLRVEAAAASKPEVHT
jgi:cystathionine beta-lyase family protein involved in aluminum resistance